MATSSPWVATAAKLALSAAGLTCSADTGWSKIVTLRHHLGLLCADSVTTTPLHGQLQPSVIAILATSSVRDGDLPRPGDRCPSTAGRRVGTTVRRLWRPSRRDRVDPAEPAQPGRSGRAGATGSIGPSRRNRVEPVGSPPGEAGRRRRGVPREEAPHLRARPRTAGVAVRTAHRAAGPGVPEPLDDP